MSVVIPALKLVSFPFTCLVMEMLTLPVAIPIRLVT